MQRCHWLFCHFEMLLLCPQGATSSQQWGTPVRFATPLAAQELPVIPPSLPCPSYQPPSLTLSCQLRLQQAQARPGTFLFLWGIHRN